MFYKLDVLRWKHLFTHGKPRKESAARLIITFLFFQFCLERENIIFDVVCRGKFLTKKINF